MRELPFIKMEGCGNDYVYLNAFDRPVFPDRGAGTESDIAALARLVSDRHFGIGSDGLVLILPPEHPDSADVAMRMFNADGSEAGMCGNASRCVGRFVWERGLVRKPVIRLETRSGVKLLHILKNDDGQDFRVCVNMGRPELARKNIPVQPGDGAGEEEPCINAPLEAAGQRWHVTGVNMGNPHAVIFVDDTESLDLPVLGPQFEHHPWFPERTNTEFVQILDESHARMRVWERGAGETLACGTGACAAAVACVLTGRTGPRLHMDLPGGSLDIEWDRQAGHVLMTGPANITFTGTFFLKD